jgi:hypothetical protein
MELRSFIKETIEQISLGINDAIEMNSQLGILVNPNITTGENLENLILPSDPEKIVLLERRVQMVKFELSLTITESGKIEVGANAGLSIFKANAHTNSESQEVLVNRINFCIPICLPITNVKQKNNGSLQ